MSDHSALTKSTAFKMEPTCLKLQKKKPTFDEWSSLGPWLGTAHQAIQFWVGDWVNLGDELFGESAAQALDSIGLELATIEVYAWVAKKVAPERRHANLSWTHHRLVAELSARDQAKWLKRAGEGDGDGPWSSARLGRELKRSNAGKATGFWLLIECVDEADLEQLAAQMESSGRKVKRQDGAKKDAAIAGGSGSVH